MAKQYHKNPRQITGKQFSDLENNLQELGDLSGVVHDLNSDEIIGGNQRSRVFDINQCEIVLTEQAHEPDEQGTVALGYVVWKGKKYAYRQVRWTPKQCEKANIVANKAGGTWDMDIMANQFEFDDLLEWGFEESELLGVDYENPRIKEKSDEIRQREMFRVLISVPVDEAVDIRHVIEELAEIPGIEIDYGAN